MRRHLLYVLIAALLCVAGFAAADIKIIGGGSSGAIGPAGPAGDNGAVGPQGPAGANGTTTSLPLDNITGLPVPVAKGGTGSDNAIGARTNLGLDDASNYPTFNQSTSGTAAGLAAQYIDWNSGSGGSSIANKPTLGGLAALDNGAAINITGNASTATTASNVAVGSDAQGDILVRSASAYGRLAAVAAGQPLLSGGATTAPAYAGYTFSATAGQTYTFPATSKTLMATDGNTSGTAANLSGTPALPDGTTATRQAADDATDKLATDNWVITQAYAKINRTKIFGFTFDAMTATDNILLGFRPPVAITITRADCYSSVDNVTGSLMECATDNVTSCTVLDSWTVTNAVDPFTDSSMTDGAVAAGAWIRWSTTSVGTSGTNTLSCTVQYNE